MRGLWWHWPVAAALVWASPAVAYEADQLTDRASRLADSLDVANAEMDRELAIAVNETNEQTRCMATNARTKAILARRLRNVTGRPAYIWSRGFWRGMGHNPYEVYLETSPEVARREFPELDDIFRKVTVDESLILHRAGIASTVRLGGHLLGTDKVAHFQVEGYDMWHKSRDGKRIPKAIHWSTSTENGWLGLKSSQVFSFGDLAANHAGMQFYQDLLGPFSVVVRDESGCVVQVKPWNWADWVTSDWDEVNNPSVYAPKVARAVRSYLASDRQTICESYRQWGNDRYRTDLAERLSRQPIYACKHAPKRTDTFQLEALCTDPSGPATVAATPTE